MIISYLSYLAFYKESSLKFLLYKNNNAEKFILQISQTNKDIDYCYSPNIKSFIVVIIS
mgnify:CR=1 FL=1